MNTPKNLLYSKSHEWIKFTGENTFELGLTDYAQNALGDLVFINLCEAGKKFAADSIIGDVESIKAVSDIYVPLACAVTEVNDALADDSSLINSDPYGAWLIRADYASGRETLLTAEEYEEFVKSLS